jgi:two-component system, OmpR family, response regulator
MRLLLVEDDAQLAEGVAAALRQTGYAVDWLAYGNEADTALQAQDYDAVILDLNLPGFDGFEVLRRMRKRQHQGRGGAIPVLILSARDEAKDRVTGLDMGADDYLTKPFDLTELEARLRALIRRSQGRSSASVVLSRLSLDTISRQVKFDGALVELTPREYGILEILMLRAGHVVSKQHLAERLCEWGDELSHSAVEIHIHRLRKKLERTGITLRTVRGFGYLVEVTHGQ